MDDLCIYVCICLIILEVLTVENGDCVMSTDKDATTWLERVIIGDFPVAVLLSVPVLNSLRPVSERDVGEAGGARANLLHELLAIQERDPQVSHKELEAPMSSPTTARASLMSY